MRKIYLYTIMLMALSLVSCSHNHDHDHDYDHEDMIILAAYSDSYEVFVEANPFAVNEESNITVFITSLSNYKPMKEGKVKATLRVGSYNIEQASGAPIKEGIYSFSFTPKSIGTAQLTIEIDSEEGINAVIFDDITVFDDEHEAQHAAHDAHPEVSNAITFSKEQSWKVEFGTEIASSSEFGQVIKTTAQIQPSSGDERIITAKTDGIVTFQDNNIVPGKSVGSGQRLFFIDASEMADNNLSVKLQEAESEYARAQTEYNRKAKLAEDNIVSQSELLQTKTELANAKANIDNLKKNFAGGKQAVSSPFSGYINDVMVKNGEYVSAGQAVLRVSQNKNLFVRADLQPKHYNSLANISTASIKVPASNEVFSLEELNGKILSYGKSSDMNNPLIPVMLQVNNNPALIPGSFVDMYIRIKSNNQVVTVPNGAVVEEMGAFFVMVQLTPELFEKRAIVKGATDGFNTHIISGISENERIVSKGAIFVKLAQDAGALDAHSGHVH